MEERILKIFINVVKKLHHLELGYYLVAFVDHGHDEDVGELYTALAGALK